VITSSAFAGKRYGVLGLARSGQAAVASLLAGGGQVVAWDAREEPRAAVLARHADAALEIADLGAMELDGLAGLVVSPGVPINRHPLAEAARAAGVPLLCDIELFAMARADLPPHKLVGITGTNGKSTTTALIAHLLQVAGVSAIMGGNIGLPILDATPLQPNANGPGVYVIELSSYQIDLTHSLDCDVALLLNISPDHLDRYDGLEGYARAKGRLFGLQSAGHLAIVGYQAEMEFGLLAQAPKGQPSLMLDAVSLPGDQAQWPSLQGPHNRANAQAAVAAVRHLGLDDATIEAGLKSFCGLPHRMERVAEVNGVVFVNDSKATNPASAAPALAAFPPSGLSDVPNAGPNAGHRRIHWILGGLPKGDDLDDCAPWFGNVQAAYTIGDAGPMFADLLEPYMPVQRAEMMSEALRRAIAAAVPGDVVLLSPACASFDQFRDYEARGDAFRQLVAVLAGPDAGLPSSTPSP
jgi:UDP-N-acetylmuramoylalanine--D-glutamate ligase